MGIDDKPEPQRVTELVDLARRRTRLGDTPLWASGKELIASGLGLQFIGALGYASVIWIGPQGFGSGPPIGPLFVGFGSIVAMVAGGLITLAGVIRWGVQPLIYYQQKAFERALRQDREDEHRA